MIEHSSWKQQGQRMHGSCFSISWLRVHKWVITNCNVQTVSDCVLRRRLGHSQVECREDSVEQRMPLGYYGD